MSAGNRKSSPRALPGEEIVHKGVADLSRNRETDASLLVLIAAPRLRRLGIRIGRPAFSETAEHRLYARLERRFGAGAHSRYNGLIRRIVSYARGREREMTARNSRVRK